MDERGERQKPGWQRGSLEAAYPGYGLLNAGIRNSTLRGGQMIFHGIRMWGQSFRVGMFLAATIVSVTEMKPAISYEIRN